MLTEIRTEPSFLSDFSGSQFIAVTLHEQCLNGDVRLSMGNSMFQGRVEMCYNGVFGSVCDISSWTMEDAKVVCSQLGFPILLQGNYCH